ncbi:MAG: MerR family transcriptional regulator [Chloroflexota bacterium]
MGKTSTEQTDSMLTIGQLAKQAGLRTSALRYYEEQQLLTPVARADNGYRLYDTAAAETVRFIQRAQRLGFALADIRTLLQGIKQNVLDEETIVQIAESRFLAIEERLTSLLALRHEMALFLQDIHARLAGKDSLNASALFAQLVDHVCTSPPNQSPDTMLDWLLQQVGCQLTTSEGLQLLEQLRGQHIHIWEEQDGYRILVVSDDPAIGQALDAITKLEMQCHVHRHADNVPDLLHNHEGFLLICGGRSAFVFARLFLTLSTKKPDEAKL